MDLGTVRETTAGHGLSDLPTTTSMKAVLQGK